LCILSQVERIILGFYLFHIPIGSPKVRCESLENNPFCFRKVTIDVTSLPVAHTW